MPVESERPWVGAVPADRAAARTTLTRFLRLERRRRFAASWRLLALPTRQMLVSQQDYAANQRAFLDSWGNRFLMEQATHDQRQVLEWLPSGFDGNIDRAYLIRVDYPPLSATPAGWDLYLLAPDGSGRWTIWLSR